MSRVLRWLCIWHTSQSENTNSIPVEANFFSQTFLQWIMSALWRNRMEHAPACTTGQVLLLVYYIKPKSRLSVRTFSCTHVAPWFFHGSTPDLLKMKCLSLGNTKFVLKGCKPCRSPSTGLKH